MDIVTYALLNKKIGQIEIQGLSADVVLTYERTTGELKLDLVSTVTHTVLSTTTVSIPVSNAVVDGRYDSANGRIELDQVSGNSFYISLQDLINSKQDTLPAGLNGTYLHRNTVTGVIEWKTISSDTPAFADIIGDPLSNANLATELNKNVKILQGTTEAGKVAKVDASGNVSFIAPDTTPTTGSTNLVTSGGVKSTIDSSIAVYHDNTKQDVIDAEHKLSYNLISGTPTIPTKLSDLTNDNSTLRLIVRHASFNADGSLISTDCTWADIQEAMAANPQKEILVFGTFNDSVSGNVYHPILRSQHSKNSNVIQFGGTFTHRTRGEFYHLCLYIPQTGNPGSDITVIEDARNKTTSWHNTPDDISYPSEKLVKDSLDLKATVQALLTETSYRQSGDSALNVRVSALEGRQQYVLIRCGVDKYIDPSTLVEDPSRLYDWTDFNVDNTADINIKAFLKVKYSMSTIEQLQAVLVSVLHTVGTDPEEDEFQYWANVTNPDIGSYPQLQQVGQFLHNAKTKVSIFTNDKAGLIKGSTTAGYVTANADGTGIVAGWNTLNGRVTTLEGQMPSAAVNIPLKDGAGAVGTSTKYAREDHVHPNDTTKEDVAYKASTWSATTTNNNYPTEKLVKDSLDTKYNVTGGLLNGTINLFAHNDPEEEISATTNIKGDWNDNYGPYLQLNGTVVEQGSSRTQSTVRIGGVATPRNGNDAANKTYVDDRAPIYYSMTLNDDRTIETAPAAAYSAITSAMSSHPVYIKVWYKTDYYFLAKAEASNFAASGWIDFYGTCNYESDRFDAHIRVTSANAWTISNMIVKSVTANATSDALIPTCKAVDTEYQRKPVLIYDKTSKLLVPGTIVGHDSDSGLTSCGNSKTTDILNITGLDVSQFKRIKVVCVRNESNTAGTFEFFIPLDYPVANGSIGVQFVSAAAVPTMGDRNRLNCCSCSISVSTGHLLNNADFAVNQTFSLYGTAATTLSTLYVVRIYGYYN